MRFGFRLIAISIDCFNEHILLGLLRRRGDIATKGRPEIHLIATGPGVPLDLDVIRLLAEI
jgi:hypothetical protein